MSGVGAPDFFCREAQRLRYVARSAFKLIQIQKQFKVITPGSSVLDLGCAPGAWLQVACQNLGPLNNGGSVVGIDIKNVKVPSSHCDNRVRTICADVMSLLKQRARALSPQGMGFSSILSDMCPSVSGITTRDSALSCELGMRALSLAVGKIDSSEPDDSGIIENYFSSTDIDADEDGVLVRGGNMVIKFLESEDVPGFGKFCKRRFRKVSWLRPKATRSSSREIYLICQDLSIEEAFHMLDKMLQPEKGEPNPYVDSFNDLLQNIYQMDYNFAVISLFNRMSRKEGIRGRSHGVLENASDGIQAERCFVHHMLMDFANKLLKAAKDHPYLPVDVLYPATPSLTLSLDSSLSSAAMAHVTGIEHTKHMVSLFAAAFLAMRVSNVWLISS